MKNGSVLLTMTMALCALLFFGGSAMADAVAPGSITLESRHTDGAIGYGGASSNVTISADGRYVAFESSAMNLVDSDTNNRTDIFLRDTVDGLTTLVSISPYYGAYGYGANSTSYDPSINGDGRYIAFYSYASNLVSGTTSLRTDVFVYDTVTGTTELVSANYGGYYGAYGYGANDSSNDPSISFDGRYVAFSSIATDLTTDTDTGSDYDVFIRDAQSDTTTRILAYGGAEPNNSMNYPAISGDGVYVAFSSNASNLLANGTTGTFSDVFVYDTTSGSTELISVAYGGAYSGSYGYGGNGDSQEPSISYGGRYVAFQSYATDLVQGGSAYAPQIFVYDRATGQMVIASAEDGGTTYGNGSSVSPSISSDGRYVAFTSSAAGLADGEGGSVYLRDTVDQTTTLVSRIDNTVAGYGAGIYGAMAYNPVVSACGTYVAFNSYADTLVADDTNGNSDVFLAINDTDGDGIADTDSDGDGTPDCVDLCPDDPDKIEPGDCGCGVIDTPDCLPVDDDDDDVTPAPRLPDTESSLDCFISTITH